MFHIFLRNRKFGQHIPKIRYLRVCCFVLTSEGCCLRFLAGQLQNGETTFLMYVILILQTNKSSTFEFPWEARNVHPTKITGMLSTSGSFIKTLSAANCSASSFLRPQPCPWNTNGLSSETKVNVTCQR